MSAAAEKLTNALAKFDWKAIKPADVVEVIVETVAERLEAIEKRVASVEEVRFCGTHQRALTYKKGNFVAHDGSLWVAVRDAPGHDPGAGRDWQLCVRHGRDSKEYREERRS